MDKENTAGRDLAILEEIARRHGFRLVGDPSAPASTAPRTLTPRQVEVLRALWRHETLKEAADALGVSTTTVKTHLAHICARLGVGGRMAALRWAAHHGLLDEW